MITDAIAGTVSYLAHLFSRGASKGEIESELGSFDRYERLLRPCFHDSSKFQLKTLSNVALHQIYQTDFSDAAGLQRIINFFERYKMDSTDIQKLIIQRVPCMENAFKLSDMLTPYRLTHLGLLIAKTKYSLFNQEDLDIPQNVINEIISR